jgi:hypothetical protein
VVSSERLGLSALHKAWAQRIASEFVRTTRFDPLHRAETEQALYDAVPGWLGALQGSETVDAVLEAGGRRHRLNLARDRVVAAVDREYEGLVQLVRAQAASGVAAILVGDRAAALPGLVARLATDTSAEVTGLPPATAATGALRWAEQIRCPDEDALPFITHLRPPPRAEAADGGPRTRPFDAAVLAPSHVVHRGLAHAITAEPLLIGSSPPAGVRSLQVGPDEEIAPHHCSLYLSGDRVVVENHGEQGTFVNGRRLEGPAGLALGDRVRLGASSEELVLVKVVGADGSP